MNNGGHKFKTSLCTEWLFRGACQRPNCHFAHGIDELQVQGRNTMESHSREQQQLGVVSVVHLQARKPCTFWQKHGACRNGDNCRFLHTDAANDMGDRGSSFSSSAFSYREPRASGSNENGNGQQQGAQERFTGVEMQALKKLLKKMMNEDKKGKNDANANGGGNQQKGGKSESSDSDDEFN